MSDTAVAEPKTHIGSLIDSMVGDLKLAPDPVEAVTPIPSVPPVEPIAPVAPESPKPPVAPEAPKPPEPPKEEGFKLMMPPEALLPKTEAVPEDFPEEAPEGSSEKASKAWKNMREAYKALKAKSVSVPPVDTGAQAEIAALRKQIDELSPIVERAAVEEHPGFREQFTLPLKTLSERGNQLMEMAGLDPQDLQSALSAKGKAKFDALEDIVRSVESKVIEGQLNDVIGKYTAKDAERELALNDRKQWREKADADLQVQQHRAREQEKQYWSQQLDSTVDVLAKNFEYFRKVEGNEEWNRGVDQRIAQAKYLLNENTDPQQTVAVAALATMTPHYREWAHAATQRAEKAEAELAAIKGGASNLKDGKSVEQEEGRDYATKPVFSRLMGELEQRR